MLELWFNSLFIPGCAASEPAPAHVLGKAVDHGTSVWAPPICGGDPDGVMSSWLQHGQVPVAVASGWNICLFLPLSDTLYFKYMHAYTHEINHFLLSV